MQAERVPTKSLAEDSHGQPSEDSVLRPHRRWVLAAWNAPFHLTNCWLHIDPLELIKLRSGQTQAHDNTAICAVLYTIHYGCYPLLDLNCTVRGNILRRRPLFYSPRLRVGHNCLGSPTSYHDVSPCFDELEALWFPCLYCNSFAVGQSPILYPGI